MSGTQDTETQGHHHARLRRRAARDRAAPPDLGVLARTAVVSFLREASIATAGEPASLADDAILAAVPERSPASPPWADDDQSPAESTAWRAAAISVAALDRIEAAAAKVEADIRAALAAQADLRAAAGDAAEAAVRAAQESWEAARQAVAADTRAQAALRRVEHYFTIIVILLIIFLVIMAFVSVP